MYFRARFWGGCVFDNSDITSESDEVGFLLVAVDDNERNDNEEREYFFVKAEIFLF